MTEKDSLYIQMFSIHGLVRSENMELGYDADTGGQVKYVIELAKALSMNEDVRRVDLFTRLIRDDEVSDDYSRPIETVNDKFRIVRIACGGDAYIRKELLWPSLDEFVENTLRFIQTEGDTPDIVHGHYPDAGRVALNLSQKLKVPFVYTGHSLGRTKKKNLLKQGADKDQLNEQIKIDHRISVEEQILTETHLVVASTNHEIESQYADYDNFDVPRYEVIPPGIDIENFQPFYHDETGDSLRDEELLFARASVEKELARFLVQADKPLILSLCRPDERKNIEGLIQAYGEDAELQAMANIAIFAGIRKDITDQEEGARDVLTRMLLLMDKYNLYGRMAIPKKHNFETEVPELYRLAAHRGGVFVNPALNEPFGITLLEASASGLPVVATRNGGPKDILENCKSGLLIDPRDGKSISGAIKEIIVHPEKWKTFSRNGIIYTRKNYTWAHHADTYLKKINALLRDRSRSDRGDGQARQTSRVNERLAERQYRIVAGIEDIYPADREDEETTYEEV